MDVPERGMLLSLSIRDFVIVEALELEFATGFTVLTGETGAGKSILIDALQFVLGERSGTDAVRENCARAEVAAEFRAGDGARAWLALSGFEAPTDDAAGRSTSVLVRRTLDSTGRGRSFVNGSPATIAQMRELGELLLDVHGQHEHQLLLRPGAQQQLLDNLGGLADAAREVAQAHARWREAGRAAGAAESARREIAAEAERLREIVEDLGALGTETGEWELLEAEHRRLAHGAALLDGARMATEEIADAEDALQPRLARIRSRLEALREFDERLAPVTRALADADIQLGEAARDLHQYLARAESDEGRLEQVDERIGALHAAGRKWRAAPAQLPQLLQTSREQLERLADSQDLAALRAAESRAEQHFRERAGALSEARKHAAGTMGREVTRAMQDLAMAGGRFEVRLVPAEPSAGGLEKAEFLVSGHEAGTARPLAKVASGGELSRIGLAIAVIAASANLVPTLIFDEVDAGIGGKVASTVGGLLRELGRTRQVFCVTHLPQVAACGEHHFAVRKARQADGRPLSIAETLSGEGRVQEVARMLGGTETTELSRRHAQEMLQNV